VNLVELEVVDLSRNLMEAVPILHLRHQRHLLALNLSRNPIFTVGPHAFRYINHNGGSEISKLRYCVQSPNS
jgi:hypothetical protein